MKCLRCGYCCINSDVIIVVDPKLGITDDNLTWKKCKKRCPHLEGEVGSCSCAIHAYEWYEDTPCYSHGQVESSSDTPCRMGIYVLQNPDFLEFVNKVDLGVSKLIEEESYV